MEKQKNENFKDEFKKRINEIDNQIDNEKKRIRKIDNIQEEVTELNKNLNKCIELLSVSIKGEKKEKMLNDMFDKNKSFYANFSCTLDDEMSITKKKINKLNEEKENLIKENKDKKE